MYKIAYEKATIQRLAKMPPKMASLIREKIKQVAINPYSPNNNIAKLVRACSISLEVDKIFKKGLTKIFPEANISNY